MKQWPYIVLVLCLLLLVVLVWKEIQRPGKARLLYRIIASFLAIAALGCLAVPLYINAPTPHTGEAVLLTEGYNPDSLDRFIQHTGQRLPVYTAEQYHTLDKPPLQTLHVFGNGLLQYEWEQLQPPAVVWHEPGAPRGFTALYWPQQVKAGETVTVQGRYAHAAAKPVQLLLRGFNTLLDSVTPSSTQQQFTLRCIPKHLGRAVYTIQVVAGKDTLQTQPLPVEVAGSAALQVLVLASSPDFDHKFLAGWLAKNGYGVAMRTLISKNKYEQTFLNTTRLPAGELNATLLNRFALVIADVAALTAAGATELAVIRSQVAQGMGLLLKTDTLFPAAAFYTTPFSLTAGSAQPERKQLLQNSQSTLAPLANAGALYIREQNGLQPLVWNENKQLLAAAGLYGSGRLVLTTLQNSYAWLLQGDSSAYQHYWHTLLQQAARDTGEAESWHVQPFIPRVHTPVQLLLQTTGTAPRAQTGENSISLAGHPLLPWQWSGRYWPDHPGWQPSFTWGGQTRWWYAFDKNDWKDLLQQERWQQTRAYLTARKLTPGVTTLPVTRRPLPQWPFFLLFLLACGYLWIEQKSGSAGNGQPAVGE
jgi:hypothetical protein